MALLKKKTEEKKENAKPSMKDLYSGKESGSETKGEQKERVYGNAYKVLVKPLITEKASILNSENKYFFEVAKNANKIEIAKAIKEVYGIKPVSVNIIRVSGKKVAQGKIGGKRKDWKKAIVTLPEGQAIKVYEGV